MGKGLIERLGPEEGYTVWWQERRWVTTPNLLTIVDWASVHGITLAWMDKPHKPVDGAGNTDVGIANHPAHRRRNEDE